jgi:hypothetical protein
MWCYVIRQSGKSWGSQVAPIDDDSNPQIGSLQSKTPDMVLCGAAKRRLTVLIGQRRYGKVFGDNGQLFRWVENGKCGLVTTV